MSVVINSSLKENKEDLKKLINIMSHYNKSYKYHITYKKKLMNEITTIDKDLSELYYDEIPFSQFVKDLKEGKHGFILNSYNKSCIQKVINNISDSKCLSIESYNNNNIQINIINKSFNINPQITKVEFQINNINIYMEEKEEKKEEKEEKKLEKKEEKEEKKLEKEVKLLSGVANTLSYFITSEEEKKEIISKFLKIIKRKMTKT
jgi:hypothetical protein